MKKISLTIKSTLAVLLIAFVCFIPVACSCNEVKAEVVYENYVDFIKQENDIFKFNSENVVVLDIQYSENVEKALEAEKDAYLNPTDTSKTMYPYSDFYIIKSIYEPMLEKSISQIGANYLLLKTQADQLNKEKCNTINENLKAVKSSTADFMTMLSTLNNNDIEFVKQDEGYPYRNPLNSIYMNLKDCKKKYENLIRDCFVLNNSFMDTYIDTLGNYSFAEINSEDFVDDVKNKSILPIVDNYLNYMVSMLSYVSFMIDGNSCSFITSNSPFYELYAHQNSDAFASRYIYNENYAKIANINLFNLTKLSETKSMDTSYLKHMNVCQNRFMLLKQQIGYFNEAVSKINFKEYVIYCRTHESAKTNYLEYALTLNIEGKNHFITVKEFLDNYFAPLAQSLKDFQDEVNND